jgi:phosphotriesterase-related protein
MPPDYVPGSVRTVLGDITADRLGHVQMHEHLIIDLWKGVRSSASEADRHRYLEPLQLGNYYWSRRYHSRDDLRLLDVDVAIEEVTAYRDAGGGTIVDVTSIGLGRDPAALAEISRATGIHVVMGCGYYYVDYHPRELVAADLDSVTDEIVRDLTVGVGDTGIRAGIIGEIGMSWPPDPAELVVLEAAAQAHLATGITISVHPGRDPNSPFDVLRRLDQHGVPPQAIVMGHVERTLTETSAILDLAASGCFVEFDLFGQESSYYSLAPAVHLPNDAGRADFIVDLVSHGHLDQVLISQDICHKTNLTRYGGEGFTHVLEHVIPLFAAKGMTPSQITAITHTNPMRALIGARQGSGQVSQPG